MKPIQTALKYLAALTLLVFTWGCATADLHEKENLAIAAGFKVITPTKPDQVALLTTLPAGKVTQINYQGKIYYVLPDLKNNQAYVGGPRQYQAYQQLRIARQISNENLMAASMNQATSMNWGTWGGWGPRFGLGWY
ncbi:MAG: hypothetical protein V4710_08380 [Verrucomicrobiota bacterium]